MSARCWVVREDHSRLAVDERGVLLGRAPGNDIMIRDPAVSSVHALVRLGPNGPEILAFGRNETRVNGEPVEGVSVLLDGDAVELPGERLRIELAKAPLSAEGTSWIVATPEGRLFGVRRSPIRVGGGAEDELHVPGLPPEALVLTLAQGRLLVEFAVPGAVSRRPVDAGELLVVDVGDVLEVDDVALRVVGEPSHDVRSTELSGQSPLPVGVRFKFLPSGGELSLVFPRGQVDLRLAESRARLVATLLGHVQDYAPGDWYPDAVLIPMVWPRQENTTRVYVNVLVHRLRQDLLKVGVNPFALIERADGATRICLAPEATVELA